MVTATRRTNGESNIPINSIESSLGRCQRGMYTK